jgi:AraC-like DNA-binding protein
VANPLKNGQPSSKSGHQALYASLLSFNPDRQDGLVVTLSVDVRDGTQGVPMHSHLCGQLVLTSRGSVICELENGLWLVPPDSALWIPPGTPHRSTVSADGTICYLYMKPEVARLPSIACTLFMTPLVRELIAHMMKVPSGYGSDSADGRIAAVLIEQLERMPVGRLHLPVPRNPRLRSVASALAADPGGRHTTREWARSVALSERSFRRLVQKETGMTFGKWRQQFQIMVAVRELAAGVSVEAVSAALGYESSSAFSVMFKKTLGHPPRVYVKQRGGLS